MSTSTAPSASAPSTGGKTDVGWLGTCIVGWIIVAATFGGMIAWAVYAPLVSAVIAPATVVADSKRKSIQHLDGGAVREILVRDGDRVEAGQILLRLDDSQIRTSQGLLQGKIDALSAQEARLLAEREGAPVIAFSPGLLARRDASPELAKILAGQQKLFAARQETKSGQVAQLRNRIQQSNAQIQGLTLREAALREQIRLINEELTGLKFLLKRGFASENKVRDLERDAARLDGERGQIQAEMAQTQRAIGEAELQILQVEKAFREDVETQLRTTQSELFDQTERLAATEAQLSRLAVRAPVAGTVMDMAIHTVGGVIAPGARIMDILPVEDRLVLEAKISPTDIDGLYIGQPADIRFSAFDRAGTPILHGHVSLISADQLINPRTEAPYFLVRVTADTPNAKQAGNFAMLPGMPAEVLISKGEKTFMQYFLKPLDDTLLKAMKQ